ncbi:hypothetical protein OAT84_03110 [Gammaproteobacteria bacterium]|nr:hypothetical protein [Gammaproteobacteria bacterium]
MNQFPYQLVTSMYKTMPSVGYHASLYYYNYGNRNAPRYKTNDYSIPAKACAYFKTTNYWRSSVKDHKVIAEDLLPQEIKNHRLFQIEYGYICTEQAIEHVRQPNEIVINVGQDTHNPFHDLEYFKPKNPYQNQSILAVWRSENGICIYWRLVCLSRTKQFSYNTSPDIDRMLSLLGLVPTRLALNAAIVAADKGKTINTWQPYYNIHLPSNYNIESELRAYPAQGNASLYQRAIIGLVEKLNLKLKDNTRPWVNKIMQSQVLSQIEDGQYLKNYLFAFEQLCEILYMVHNPVFMKPSAQPGTLNKTIKSLLGPVVDDLPIHTSFHNYSMSITTMLLKKYLVKQESLKIVVSNQQYYESASNVKFLKREHDTVECVTAITKLKTTPDIILTEFHPNNAAATKHHPQDITKAITKIYKKNPQHKLVVIIDIAMNHYQDECIQTCIEKLKPFLNQGLALYMVQSCAKVIQLGADVFPGGILISFNGQSIPINKHLSPLECYYSMLLKESHTYIIDYVQSIRENTQTVYRLLKPHFKGRSFIHTVENSDPNSAYLSFSIEYPNNDVKAYYVKKISYLAAKYLRIDQRASFGFSKCNISGTAGNIRLSIGLESLENLEHIAERLINFNKILTALSEVWTPNTTCDINVFYKKMTDILYTKPYGAQFALTGHTVSEYSSPIPMQFSVRIRNYLLTITGENISVNERISWHEKVLLILMIELDLVEKFKLAIETLETMAPSFSIVEFEPMKYHLGPVFFGDDGDEYIQQFSPLSAKIIKKEHTLQVIFNGQQYDSSDIQVQRHRSGDNWILADALDGGSINAIFKKYKQYIFTVTIKDNKAQISFKPKQKRINLHQELKSMILSNTSINEILPYAIENQQPYANTLMSCHKNDALNLIRFHARRHQLTFKDIQYLEALSLEDKLLPFAQAYYEQFAHDYIWQIHMEHQSFQYLIENNHLDHIQLIHELQKKCKQAGPLTADYWENMHIWLKYISDKFSHRDDIMSRLHIDLLHSLNSTWYKQYIHELYEVQSEKFIQDVGRAISNSDDYIGRKKHKRLSVLLSDCLRVSVEFLLPQAYLNKLFLKLRLISDNTKSYWLYSASICHTKYDAEMLDACDLYLGDFDVVITSRCEKMLRQYLEKSDIKLQNRHEKWIKMCGKNSYASILSNS